MALGSQIDGLDSTEHTGGGFLFLTLHWGYTRTSFTHIRRFITWRPPFDHHHFRAWTLSKSTWNGRLTRSIRFVAILLPEG